MSVISDFFPLGVDAVYRCNRE